MPYCENCGQPVSPNANFCGNCGSPRKQQVQAAPVSPPPPAPMLQTPPIAPVQPQPSTEQIINFIIATKSKRFGGDEYYTGILTSQRLIFAPMTKDNLKEVTDLNRQYIKNGYSALPVFPYQQMYLSSTPEMILANTQGCIVIANSAIREITLRTVDITSDGYSVGQQYEIQIKTDMGTQTFHMTKRDEYPARLRQVYGGKVKP
jgi:hypothetical protein